MQLTIKHEFQQPGYTIEVTPLKTVRGLKRILQQESGIIWYNIGLRHQKLGYLDDDQTLAYYGIYSDTELALVDFGPVRTSTAPNPLKRQNSVASETPAKHPRIEATPAPAGTTIPVQSQQPNLFGPPTSSYSNLFGSSLPATSTLFSNGSSSIANIFGTTPSPASGSTAAPFQQASSSFHNPFSMTKERLSEAGQDINAAVKVTHSNYQRPSVCTDVEVNDAIVPLSTAQPALSSSDPVISSPLQQPSGSGRPLSSTKPIITDATSLFSVKANNSNNNLQETVTPASFPPEFQDISAAEGSAYRALGLAHEKLNKEILSKTQATDLVWALKSRIRIEEAAARKCEVVLNTKKEELRIIQLSMAFTKKRLTQAKQVAEGYVNTVQEAETSLGRIFKDLHDGVN